MATLARLDPNGDASLWKWKEKLESEKYKAIYEDVAALGSKAFIFGFVSPRQQKVDFISYILK